MQLQFSRNEHSGGKKTIQNNVENVIMSVMKINCIKIKVFVEKNAMIVPGGENRTNANQKIIESSLKALDD